MIPVETLLADLSARGVELQPHGDRLRFRPQQVVTADLAERLRTHKAAVLALLADLAARLEALKRHVAAQAADQAWCDLWNSRLQTPGGWQSPLRVAGYLIEDCAEPAAVSGNAKRFNQLDSYIRADLLEADDWEQRCFERPSCGIYLTIVEV